MSKPYSKRTDRFIETEIDGETVVMDLETGDFFSLSGSALSVWLLIDGTRDRSSLLSAVASEYQANEAEIAADVDDFVAELAAARLVDGG